MITIMRKNRKSIRLKEYDYSQPGEYFITICTHNHECLFGEIIKEEMRLNEFGKIAEKLCKEIPEHFMTAQLDEYVVMPNHIHGIIILCEHVGTRHAVSLQKHERFGNPTHSSIPTIIRSFKSAVTKRINEMWHSPLSLFWQSKFYDRVIRNDKELNNVRDYIRNNILLWAFEKDDPDNLPLW